MPAPRPRAVFFDIGNVLLRFSAAKVVRDVAWRMRRSPVKVARYLWGSDLGRRVELGEIGGRELHEEFRAKLDWDGSWAEFKRLWCDHFEADRGSTALLKKVSASTPTYLLSNTNALHYDFIKENYAFASQVKGAILSHEVRLRKPDPAIYRAALALSGTAPEETVFVDDLKENVAGAAKVGLIAIRYRGADDLKRRFAALGLV
jgi:glucose-1-phosphatase